MIKDKAAMEREQEQKIFNDEDFKLLLNSVYEIKSKTLSFEKELESFFGAIKELENTLREMLLQSRTEYYNVQNLRTMIPAAAARSGVGRFETDGTEEDGGACGVDVSKQ